MKSPRNFLETPTMFRNFCIGSLVFLFVTTVASGQDQEKFKRHPLAPSLPLLSDDENAKIDKIIDQFIDYDSGKRPGADGKKIVADFNGLGPAAIPPLIDGLN